MGIGTFITDEDTQTGDDITAEHIRQFKDALNGVIVGRLNDIPAAGQAIGTETIPFGSIRCGSLIIEGQAVDVGRFTAPLNRIITGKTRPLSAYPDFIEIENDNLTIKILGQAINLIMSINGETTTIDSDVSVALQSGYGSSHTANINDAGIVNNKTAGEAGYVYGDRKHGFLTIDAAGSQISNRVGEYSWFKNGSEYFSAFIRSSTRLERIKRRHGFGVNGDPHPEAGLSDDGLIEIIRTGWVFIDRDTPNSPDVSYTSPVFSDIAPTSPATGQYWIRTRDNRVLRYDGSQFVLTERLLVATVGTDSNGAVVYRCTDFQKTRSNQNTARLRRQDEEVFYLEEEATVSVDGNTIKLIDVEWDMARDYFNSYNLPSEAANTYYGLYLTEKGHPEIIGVLPTYREGEGWMLPWDSFKCLAVVYNNVDSDFAEERNFFPWQKFNPNGKQETVFYYSYLTSPARVGRDDSGIGLIETFAVSGVYVNHNLKDGVFTDIPIINLQTVDTGGTSSSGVISEVTVNSFRVRASFNAGNIQIGYGGNQLRQALIDNLLK